MLKPHFKILRLPTNQGHGIARRSALDACSYDWVALMDADDISVPTRFERQLAFLATHPQTDVIGGQIAEFTQLPQQPNGIRQVFLQDQDIKNDLKKRCPFNQMSVMFKKDAVKKAGGYLEWYCNEDYYLWARMTLAGAVFANLPDVLVNVRTGNTMIARRGGWKYFESEARLQAFLWKRHLIAFPRLVYNILLRFGGEVLLPGCLRVQVLKLLRKSPRVAVASALTKHADYPPFSVALCVYGKDTPAYFKASLESIVHQTVTPTEIVIVVDGPIPDSLQHVLEEMV